MDIQNPKLNTLSLSKNLFRFLLIFIFPILSNAADLRIVSLSPALTEVLFELGLQDKIVGTSSFSDFPSDAKKIPTVGSYLKPSIEKILRLNPTHVLVFKEGDPTIAESLKNAKLNYIVYDSRTLEDFEKMIQSLGSTFNVDKKAQNILNLWKTQWEAVSQLPKVNKKIMIQVDNNPIFIAGSDTFISKAFEKCGLENTFKNLDGYKKVQMESVVNRKPDVILVVGMLNGSDTFSEIQNFWNKNPVTKNSSVIKADGDSMSRLSTRLPSAVIKTCSEIRSL
jgi:ABC-type Fe3+-hydroxamate transport system substrate-binding protein